MGFRALTEERESAFLSLELTGKDEKICVDMAYKGMWVGLGAVVPKESLARWS